MNEAFADCSLPHVLTSTSSKSIQCLADRSPVSSLAIREGPLADPLRCSICRMVAALEGVEPHFSIVQQFSDPS